MIAIVPQSYQVTMGIPFTQIPQTRHETQFMYQSSKHVSVHLVIYPFKNCESSISFAIASHIVSSIHACSHGILGKQQDRCYVLYYIVSY